MHLWKLNHFFFPGAFGIVYKGLLMDWNNVAIRGVALKTLKGYIIFRFF